MPPLENSAMAKRVWKYVFITLEDGVNDVDCSVRNQDVFIVQSGSETYN